MIFSTDHYFTIGSAHASAGMCCQDYALSRGYQDSAHIVVSDGCSTGGNTDIGARVIASAMSASIDSGCILHRRSEIVAAVKDSLNIKTVDLLGTCLSAYISATGGWYRIEGDGVVAIRYRDGHTWIKKFDWMDNTPWYPAYTGDPSGFLSVHEVDAYRLLSTTCVLASAGGYRLQEHSHPTSEGMAGIERRFTAEEVRGIDCIALFSDGICQIDQVPWWMAVREFLAFKNTNGEFVKRRAMAALRGMKEFGRGPVDDVSVAVIRVD